MFIFLSYRSPFILHVLLLHVSSCMPVTWIVSVIDIDIHVTGYMNCWYALCATPHLLFPVSRYPVSACSILVLLGPCTVLVLDILCSSYLYSGTPVISTVTPASDGTCVELSATRSKVPHHTYPWWGPPLEFMGATSRILTSPGVGWRGCLCNRYPWSFVFWVGNLS